MENVAHGFDSPRLFVVLVFAQVLSSTPVKKEHLG